MLLPVAAYLFLHFQKINLNLTWLAGVEISFFNNLPVSFQQLAHRASEARK